MMTKRGEENFRPRPPPAAAAMRDSYKQHLDERLDEALEETFPASDPIALTPRRGQASRLQREPQNRMAAKPSS